MELDKIDKDLLNIIQSKFPLNERPYSLLAAKLGISPGEVIHRIERLKAARIIRLIGPVLNPGRLGYRTTLVAAMISETDLDEANRIIVKNSMVSHCYQRDHDFNLWFTLALPVTEDMDRETRKLGNSIGAKKIISLPALKTFKIEALFGIAGTRLNPLPAPKTANATSQSSNETNLSNIDRSVINALQDDLPLIEQPFDFISDKLGMSTEELLLYCQNLLQRGIMRRFSAAVNHSRLGFTANAMTCWRVSQIEVDTAGKKIASFGEVSHCYERQINSVWPYNLFAMVHEHSRENCLAVIDRISIESSVNNNERILLFSTKEVKKTRVKYKV